MFLQNLLYKLQRKLKVFNTTDPLPNRGYNLVACASKYGIVFIASPDGHLTGKHEYLCIFVLFTQYYETLSNRHCCKNILAPEFLFLPINKNCLLK